MIAVEYFPNKSKNDDIYCLIGKGVTFDTGGINLKPTRFIEDMYIDKSGAAAIFSVF